MDGAAFTKAIQVLGEKNIIGFVFDNSSRELFYENNFSLAEHYNAEIEALQFKEKSIAAYGVKGTEYISVCPVENIQKILVATPDTKWDVLDARYMTS